MRHFLFKVVKEEGKLVRGLISSETAAAARGKLEGEYGTLVTLEEVTDDAEDAPRISSRGISTTDLASYTRQLSLLQRAGITMPRAFELVANGDCLNLNLVFSWLSLDVSRGHTLSSGLSRFPRIFDPVFVALVRAGEVSGRLDTNLNRAADLLEAQDKLRKRVRGALVYPLAVAVIAFVVLGVFVGFILPTLRPSYEEMGLQLPLITRLVLSVGDLAFNPFILVGVGVGGWFGWAGLKRYLATPGGREAVEARVRRIPIIGPTLEKQEIVGILFILASMLDSGVVLSETILVAQEASTTAFMRRGLYKTFRRLLEGDTFVDSLRVGRIFPRAVLQMVEVGEQSGTTSHMLRCSCQLYEEEVDQNLATLANVMEPLIVVVVGVVVGIITLAAFLPGFTLVDQL